MFASMKRHCSTGVVAVGVLVAGILMGSAATVTMASAPKANRGLGPEAGGPGATYSLGYSQISLGACSGGSSRYSVEDVVSVASCDGASQSSGRYMVTSPLGVPNATPPKKGLRVPQWNVY